MVTAEITTAAVRAGGTDAAAHAEVMTAVVCLTGIAALLTGIIPTTTDVTADRIFVLNPGLNRGPLSSIRIRAVGARNLQIVTVTVKKNVFSSMKMCGGYPRTFFVGKPGTFQSLSLSYKYKPAKRRRWLCGRNR